MWPHNARRTRSKRATARRSFRGDPRPISAQSPPIRRAPILECEPVSFLHGVEYVTPGEVTLQPYAAAGQWIGYFLRDYPVPTLAIAQFTGLLLIPPALASLTYGTVFRAESTSLVES